MANYDEEMISKPEWPALIEEFIDKKREQLIKNSQTNIEEELKDELDHYLQNHKIDDENNCPISHCEKQF